MMGTPVSLALRSDQRTTQTPDRAAAVPPPSSPRVIGAVDFRQLARRAAAPTPPKAEAPAAGVTPQQALDLLCEASTALPALMARCHGLEAALADSKEKGRVDLEAANEVAREWQGVAERLRTQLEAVEKNAAALRSRAETAEADLTAVRADADRAHQTAAEAECLSSLFQEKVIAAFGIGSPGHTILESVRNRTQQMLTA